MQIWLTVKKLWHSVLKSVGDGLIHSNAHISLSKREKGGHAINFLSKQHRPDLLIKVRSV